MTSAGKSWTATVGGYPITVRVAEDEHGLPMDVQASCGPPGNAVAMLMECILRVSSMSLAAGVPLREVVKGLSGHRFPPDGPTSDPLAPSCLSLVDYVARSLEARYLVPAQLAAMRGEVGQ
jgi:hypothetical protein